MDGSARQQRDWVSSPLSRFLAWGVPTAVLVIAIFMPPARTLIWSVSLLWMGVACIANATRCGRTHCYFMGPFFLIMAVAVVLHGRAAKGTTSRWRCPRWQCRGSCSEKSSASSTGCGRPLCRHDGGPSSSIRVARQDRCALPRQGAPSACEMTIGHGCPSPDHLDKGRIAAYRAGLEPES